MVEKTIKPFSGLLQPGLLRVADVICIHDNSGDFVSDGIEWFTAEPGQSMDEVPSHIEQIVDVREFLTIGARLDGVKVHKLTEYFDDRFTLTVRRIIDLRPDQEEKIRQEDYAMVSRKWEYGWTAYFGFAVFCLFHKIGWDVFSLPNPTKFKNFPVCSHVPDISSLLARKDCFPEIGAGSVTPNHWLRSPRLKTVIVV